MKGVVFLGFGLLAVGLPLGAYYASYLSLNRSTISPALTPDVLFNVLLLEGVGVLLTVLGAAVVTWGFLKGSRVRARME